MSDDGQTWREVRAGVLESARDIRFLDLATGVRTRFVRPDIAITWSAAIAPNFYRQLRIDEIQTGFGHPTGHG